MGINGKIREAVLRRDDYTCQQPGCPAKDRSGRLMHIDHRVPRAKGGTDDMANLITLCQFHNLRKSDRDEADEYDPPRQRSFYLPRMTDEKLVALANRRGVSLSECVLDLLRPVVDALPMPTDDDSLKLKRGPRLQS